MTCRNPVLAVAGLPGSAGASLSFRMLKLVVLLTASAAAGTVEGYADLHLHLAAHETLPIYGDGPAEELPEHPSNRHTARP